MTIKYCECCGKPINNRTLICDACGTDYNEKPICEHIYGMIEMCDDPKYLLTHLYLKCEKCGEVTSLKCNSRLFSGFNRFII